MKRPNPVVAALQDVANERSILLEMRKVQLREREDQEAEVRARRELLLERWNRQMDLREAECELRRRGELTSGALRDRQERILAEDAEREAEGARWSVENAKRAALWDAQDAEWFASRVRLSSADAPGALTNRLLRN